MAAEVSSGSCVSLRAQLDTARLGLQRLERDIRRAAVNTKRYQPDRNLDRSFQGPPNVRGTPRLSKPFFQDGTNNQRSFDDRLAKKRPQETKTVFSRLSVKPAGDSDAEEETTFTKKPRLSSQVIRDLPTKQEVLKAQSGDEESKARNRRMFGSLLGTLQKFKQEAIVLQNKEDKKAQIEKKIEEQAKQEKENQKKERQNLFAEREIKKATIKALEAKMVRMREFEKWELAHTTMLGFIQTKGKPQIFWKPKKMTETAEEKLNISKKNLEKLIEKKRQDVTSELNAIEQRCLRNIRLPPGSQLRPTSLFPSSEMLINDHEESMDMDDSVEHQDNDRVNSSIVVVKQEKDENDRKVKITLKDEASNVDQKQDKELESKDRKVENGKPTGERWNREETESSSDENSVDHVDEHKDHSMDESSQHVEDNSAEDPGGVPVDSEKKSDTEENECAISSSAMETDLSTEK